jgi:hypothetical protein
LIATATLAQPMALRRSVRWGRYLVTLSWQQSQVVSTIGSANLASASPNMIGATE